MATREILNPGDVFAGYTIERLLGIGGMGTVYRARDPELPRSVALKLLHRDLTANDYIRSRFELEAAHAASLEHPNIVPVYRRGRADDQLWIAMQFVDSTDAAEVLRDGPLRPADAVHIITETAKALDHAHAAGVLHRDVKPANILLERSGPGRPGRVLLADFGIAKALAETTQITQTGMVVASLQYASPEQFENIALDARADVYSLGCTFFHLLTGQLPYPGTTMPQLWAGHVKAPIPKPSEVRPGIPRTFDAVIERVMAKQRGDRYPSCGEFVRAAQAALRSPRTPPPPPPPLPVDEGSATTVAATLVEPPRVPGAGKKVINDPARFVEPPRPLARPVLAAGTADGVFRGVAQAGVIVLGALVCAALLTWKSRVVASWQDGLGDWHYPARTVYVPLSSWIAPSWFGVEKAALCLTAVVGAVMLLAALVLMGTRRLLAARLARGGGVLFAFASLLLALAYSPGVTPSTRTWEMQLLALFGAVLLLGGCWRGLSPSPRNRRWLVGSGLAVVAYVIAIHVLHPGVATPVLGDGGGGLIAGIALIGAGVALRFVAPSRAAVPNPVVEPGPGPGAPPRALR